MDLSDSFLGVPLKTSAVRPSPLASEALEAFVEEGCTLCLGGEIESMFAWVRFQPPLLTCFLANHQRLFNLTILLIAMVVVKEGKQQGGMSSFEGSSSASIDVVQHYRLAVKSKLAVLLMEQRAASSEGNFSVGRDFLKILKTMPPISSTCGHRY